MRKKFLSSRNKFGKPPQETGVFATNQELKQVVCKLPVVISYTFVCVKVYFWVGCGCPSIATKETEGGDCFVTYVVEEQNGEKPRVGLH